MAGTGRDTVLVDEGVELPAGVSFDGGADVLLAPVQGVDPRRSVPKEMFEKRPSRFAVKFAFAMALIAASTAVIAVGVGWWATAIAIVVIGAMFAHLVELQHECLHEHAFRSRRLNRWFGVVCGMFVFSSYSHYKYQHLRHHAYLGTSRNREFFNYRFKNLDSVHGFVYGAMHLGRYKDVARDVVRSLLGRPIPGVTSNIEAKKIRAEYRFYVVAAVVAVVGSIVTGSSLLVWAWLIPAILVAEAAHFLIELPEHFGLNTLTDPNVIANTRTIRSSAFGRWYTNFNNLHTAHHYHQGVPMAQIEKLHAMASPSFEVIDHSYFTFYRKVISGEICQDLRQNVMTR